jgi:FlaA1/EpsC-like NDP-sugar epimerase
MRAENHAHGRAERRIAPPERVLRFHRPLLFLAQTIICMFSVMAAFVLRFDSAIPLYYRPAFRFALLVWPLSKLFVFWAGGLSRGWWRYVSLPDMIRLSLGNVAASIVVTVITAAFGPVGFPRSTFVIDFLVCVLITSASQVSRRIHWEMSQSRVRGTTAVERTLIYGAGNAGVSLLREIRQNANHPYYVVGLLDDDRAKTGALIQGARVLGTGADLGAMARKHRARTVLVAIPSASGQQMTAILQQCHSAGVVFKTIPGLSRILDNVDLTAQIRDVAVEDLLGRSPVALEHHRIREKVGGRVILVTGAAGSIGSELCRQIARYRPEAIVGFEMSETGLFHLEHEMRKSFPGVAFYPEIGNIQNRRRVEDVVEQYLPAMIFHAAAYKHVPMMEAHLFEAVENNVFGTYNFASAAVRYGVDDFILISSDKAVRPTSIMGATKRISEFIILSFANSATKFAAVRFGNVLASNGSVVPMFKQQILAGGPVTVTDPEMRRFFMTIPEASQLVLQASAMGRGGEVFVLDMGDPVRIVDLARNLILLSGLRPNVDIRIEYTGTRPGEKLYEELSHLEEGTVPTVHEKVRVFSTSSIHQPDLRDCLANLREGCATRDNLSLILALKKAIPDYVPSDHVLTRAAQAEPV